MVNNTAATSEAVPRRCCAEEYIDDDGVGPPAMAGAATGAMAATPVTPFAASAEMSGLVGEAAVEAVVIWLTTVAAEKPAGTVMTYVTTKLCCSRWRPVAPAVMLIAMLAAGMPSTEASAAATEAGFGATVTFERLKDPETVNGGTGGGAPTVEGDAAVGGGDGGDGGDGGWSIHCVRTSVYVTAPVSPL